MVPTVFGNEPCTSKSAAERAQTRAVAKRRVLSRAVARDTEALASPCRPSAYPVALLAVRMRLRTLACSAGVGVASSKAQRLLAHRTLAARSSLGTSLPTRAAQRAPFLQNIDICRLRWRSSVEISLEERTFFSGRSNITGIRYNGWVDYNLHT